MGRNKIKTHKKFNRRSIRLDGYDYLKCGVYFVTICMQNRECLFWDIVMGKINLNDAGKFAQKYWKEIPNHYLNILLDAFVIMPNHIHRIIIGKGTACRAPTKYVCQHINNRTIR